MADNKFDLIVIGGGPGGYVASIRAAQLGMKVACVEKRTTLGGTCLNVGCIPSKALLDSSELYHQAKEGMAVHGVTVGQVKLDLKTMMGRKEKVVGELTQGIASLFKKNKITHISGTARLVSGTSVEVTQEKGKAETFEATRVLIATGSEPFELPGIPFDGTKVISSTEALSLSKVPKHLIVIGGGVIGLELGSVWQRLGAKVTVIEMLPQPLGNLDTQINRLAQRTFSRQGMEFHLETRVTAVDAKGKEVKVTAENAKGEKLEFNGDHVLVAVGRKPFVEGLGAKEVGVAFNERGFITVNDHYQTSVPTVYAIGDVTPGPMLAHKASEEGVAAVDGMAGLPAHMNYDAIPFVVYTWPEIAWVGRGEEELKAAGIEYRTGTFPMQATARAKAMGEKDGMVKVISDARTDKLLGVIMFGPRASDVIGEAAVAVEFGGSAEDLARSVHAHPTFSEAIKEAALGVEKRAIHL